MKKLRLLDVESRADRDLWLWSCGPGAQRAAPLHLLGGWVCDWFTAEILRRPSGGSGWQMHFYLAGKSDGKKWREEV